MIPMSVRVKEMNKWYSQFPIAFAVLFLSVTIAAQADQIAKADSLLAEAKTLVAANTIESLNKAIAKLDEAAGIYKTTGPAEKRRETDLLNGQVHRILSNTEIGHGHDAEALTYLNPAVEILSPYGKSLELAYVYHNLGLIHVRQKKHSEAIDFYKKSLANYQAVNDRAGEASVFRNMGLILYNLEKYTDAIVNFEASLKIHTAAGSRDKQAVLLADIGDALQGDKRHEAALVKFSSALALYREVKNDLGAAYVLFQSGNIREGMLEYKQAIRDFEEALTLYGKLSNKRGIADATQHIGALQLYLENYPAAEEKLRIAADLYIPLGDKGNEANCSLMRATALRALGRLAEAKAAADRGLLGFKEAKDEIGRAYGLLIFADIHSFLNEHSEALAKINEAQAVFKVKPAPFADFRIARALSFHYYALSNYGEAVKYGLAALAFAEKLKDDSYISSALTDVANAYSRLGQYERSIAYQTRAYDIAKKLKNRPMEAVALSNLGYDSYLSNKLPESERYTKLAIDIMRAEGMFREEGYATHNLGMLYKKRGEYALAKANYDRALPLYLKAGDRRPEAFLWDSYGELYIALGEFEKASDALNKAVVMSREIQFRDVEASALTNMMDLWARRGQRRLAVLYGKQAVNLLQAIRSGNSALDKASQKSFVRSNEDKYRQLANILIDDGRLGEAQQVLDLLKEEEFMDFVRRDASEAADQVKLALTDSERKALDEYTRLSGQLTALGTRFQNLQDAKVKAGGKLSAAEETEFQNLKTQIEEAGVGIRAYLAKLSDEFSKKVEDQAVITPESIESLRADLRRAGSDVVLVSTYLLPERYRAIVTTGRAMVDRKVEYKDRKLTASDINRKIAEFQRALQNPRVDPRPLGKELYDIFVKPLEADLEGAKAKTILWSLDGTLRYIPIAALSPDGKTYLAEKYQNVLVTLARQTNLFANPTTDEWRALGAGVSKPHEGFPALPSVINELNSIVREDGTSGVLNGKQLVDEKFDVASLRASLPQTTEDGKSFNVVHLATHFKLGVNDQDSALLLGDGKRLSLFEISKDEELDFKDVELLALSACETGVAAGDGSGREVESLGMLAQKKGAKAVLATLWKVADEGTSMFMSEFYRLKKADPKLSKAEAIRLAQKQMIDGKIKSTGKGGGCRADEFVTSNKPNAFKCDPNAPFSHPYFWSPFVLIGNWR